MQKKAIYGLIAIIIVIILIVSVVGVVIYHIETTNAHKTGPALYVSAYAKAGREYKNLSHVFVIIFSPVPVSINTPGTFQISNNTNNTHTIKLFSGYTNHTGKISSYLNYRFYSIKKQWKQFVHNNALVSLTLHASYAINRSNKTYVYTYYNNIPYNPYKFYKNITFNIVFNLSTPTFIINTTTHRFSSAEPHLIAGNGGYTYKIINSTTTKPGPLPMSIVYYNSSYSNDLIDSSVSFIGATVTFGFNSVSVTHNDATIKSVKMSTNPSYEANNVTLTPSAASTSADSGAPLSDIYIADVVYSIVNYQVWYNGYLLGEITDFHIEFISNFTLHVYQYTKNVGQAVANLIKSHTSIKPVGTFQLGLHQSYLMVNFNDQATGYATTSQAIKEYEKVTNVFTASLEAGLILTDILSLADVMDDTTAAIVSNTLNMLNEAIGFTKELLSLFNSISFTTSSNINYQLIEIAGNVINASHNYINAQCTYWESTVATQVNINGNTYNVNMPMLYLEGKT